MQEPEVLTDMKKWFLGCDRRLTWPNRNVEMEEVHETQVCVTQACDVKKSRTEIGIRWM